MDEEDDSWQQQDHRRKNKRMKMMETRMRSNKETKKAIQVEKEEQIDEPSFSVKT